MREALKRADSRAQMKSKQKHHHAKSKKKAKISLHQFVQDEEDDAEEFIKSSREKQKEIFERKVVLTENPDMAFGVA